MRSVTVLLGLLLVGSITGNAVLMHRLSRKVEPAPRSTGPAPAANGAVTPKVIPSGSNERMDLILAELSAIRHEMAELKSRPGPSSPAPAARPGGETADAPKTGTSNPKLVGIFAEQELVQGFWKDMAKLSGARASLKGDEYRTMVLDTTADFLGLTGGVRTNFMQTCGTVSAEIEKAYKEYTDAISQVKYDPKNQEAYQNQYQAIYQCYNDAMKNVNEQIKAVIPQETPRQKQFATTLVSQWTGYFSAQGAAYSNFGSAESFGGLDE